MGNEKEQIDVSNILSEGIARIPEKTGCYRIIVKENKYEPDLHGQSRVIYIGGMNPGKNSSLSKRIGEFIGAAMGFAIFHAGGRRFWQRHEELKLNIHDLLIQYRISDDPLCAEVNAFEEFEKEFQKEKPLLCKARRRKRYVKHRKH